MKQLCCYMILCFILFYLNGSEGSVNCIKKGQCGCQLDDNSAYMDLSPLISVTPKPMFVGIDTQAGINTWDIDLCQKFTCTTNNDAMICQSSTVTPSPVIIADTLSSFEYDTESKIVTYVYTGSGVGATTTRILMHCTQDSGPGRFSEIETQGETTFTTTLSSRYACLKVIDNGGGGSKRIGGLSKGSIICIVLLVVIVVYVISGLLINKYVRKVEEDSLFPNAEFWKTLPGYIKDGCKFTFSKMKRNKEEYEQI